MSVIVLLIAAGGVVAAGFLAAFAWAVKSGQFDDTTTPAVRMLLETRRPPEETQASSWVGKPGVVQGARAGVVRGGEANVVRTEEHTSSGRTTHIVRDDGRQ
jgi:cbb3-type cytochrome oxidase maturation protein